MNSGKLENIVESEYDSIYDLFRFDYPFSKKEKQLIALSVISDTEYLKSTGFKEQDKKLYESLNIKLNMKN